MNRVVIVLVVLAALSGLGWYLNALAYGLPDAEETRTQFVTELEGFGDYEAHRDLLLETIDREHVALFEATKASSRKRFKYESYRDSLYFKLMSALRDAGETDAATNLDRFRAGG
jgi:hypothetical protein